MPIPDFYLVGAFKCGTTALYDYLRQHPQIYMPFHKEPLFFGDDLTRRYGRMTRSQYEALFADAKPGQRIGEASAWYLYSRSAAREIKAAAPDARIIVMLRNPVDVMYAQHSQLLFNVEENIVDFADALAAEPARRRGERLPPGPLRVENLYYRESVQFADQLRRYLDAFGRERVLVIVYDDFRDNTPGTYRRVLEFLGVDPTVVAAFGVSNPNKRVRSRILQRLVYQPPGPLVRLVPVIRRFPFAHAVRARLLGLNSAAQRRSPMDPNLRHRLLAEFESPIRDLGELIGRDLSPWLADPIAPAA
ncbi:MAG TPA: sulfotransferase [Candidatus Limnocylindria bacterium]